MNKEVLRPVNIDHPKIQKGPKELLRGNVYLAPLFCLETSSFAGACAQESFSDGSKCQDARSFLVELLRKSLYSFQICFAKEDKRSHIRPLKLRLPVSLSLGASPVSSPCQSLCYNHRLLQFPPSRLQATDFEKDVGRDGQLSQQPTMILAFLL